MAAHPRLRRVRRTHRPPGERQVQHDERRSSWWWSAAVACLALYPYLIVVVLGDPRGDRTELAASASTLLSDLLVLAAGVALALDARLSAKALRASMAVAAILVAVQDAPLVVLGLVEPDFRAHSYRLTSGHLVTVLIVAIVIGRGRRAARPSRHIMALGFLLGVVALLATLGLNAVSTGLEGSSEFLCTAEAVDVLQILLIGVVLLGIGAQLWFSPLPAWASSRIGIGMLAIFAARLWSTLDGATAPKPAAVVGVAVFSALTATTAITLLRRSLEQAQAAITRYADLAAAAEAEVKQDREVAHEVRSTAAGIAAAARLLASGSVPPGPRREALERMVDSEAARLARTTEARQSPVTVVDVDGVVTPLVVAQGARGHAVAWTPQGHRVLARSDALAEVLTTLVNNAAHHGGGQGTTITTGEVGDLVVIVVSDDGPGIDPAVRDSLFDWGTHRSLSEGQGIGLHRAHRLVLEQGGTLELVDDPEVTGTAFVITLARAQANEADETDETDETS